MRTKFQFKNLPKERRTAMCNYEIIEKNKAGVIVRDATKVRCYNDGSEMLYCMRDLFNACKLNSVDSSMKGIARLADDDPKAKVTLVSFPFCSLRAGWRTTKMYFANERAFRLYMKGRFIPKDVKEWLISEVFTFRLDKMEDDTQTDYEQIGLNTQFPDSKAKASESKAENVVDLNEVIKKNGSALQIEAAHRNAGTPNGELNAAIDKMVLAMLDVMKLLIEDRSNAEDKSAGEPVAS